MTRNTLLQASDITKSIGGKNLFQGASFSLMDDSRVGLIGINGAGKSSLLRILAGLDTPDAGSVTKRRGLVVEYIPQALPTELRNLTAMQAMKDKAAHANRPIEEWRIGYLIGLTGLREEDLHKPLGSLSGGELNRILLARALLVEPDLLLLDEPTNHLDSQGIAKFERILREHLVTPFCIVSHDRELIDTSTTETLIIRDNQLYHFRLPYSAARNELQRLDEAAAHQRAIEEREIKRLEVATERLHRWAHISHLMAPRYRAMQTRLAKAKEKITFVTRSTKRDIQVGLSTVQADSIVTIENFDVQVGTPRQHLFKVDEFRIAPGDRVALLGVNGSGKSTLLRALVNEFYQKGSNAIRFNPRTVLGYYDQELAQLPHDRSLLDFVQAESGLPNQRIHQELVAAGFPYDSHHRQIRSLSGGEQARLKILSIKLANPNLLVLDEPTNHLDVQGIERLEDQLLDSGGTLLFVSHDRRFVSNVASRFILIHQGQLREIEAPEPYYALLEEELATPPPLDNTETRDHTPSPPRLDDLMAQIEALELQRSETRAGSPHNAELTAKIDSLYNQLSKRIS